MGRSQRLCIHLYKYDDRPGGTRELVRAPGRPHWKGVLKRHLEAVFSLPTTILFWTSPGRRMPISTVWIPGSTQVAWAAGLTLGGVSGWRLPTVRPVDGSTFDTTFSNNATTDWGYAPTTTDGTDGGWRDVSNTPVSEMGHMYYVTLGNLGACTPDDADPSSCAVQPGRGLTNTGPFRDIQSGAEYWSGTELSFFNAWDSEFDTGIQTNDFEDDDFYAWAVRSGDVPATVVPVPAAVWLFASGLIGLLGVARQKKA